MSFNHNFLNVNGDGDIPPPLPPHEDDGPSVLPIQDLEWEIPHALMIEETVKVIMSHVQSFQDLKTFRLVCKTWNREVARVLSVRCDGWINFFLDRQFRMPPNPGSGGLNDIRRFLELLDETQTWGWKDNEGPILPCSKFRLDTAIHYADAAYPDEKQAVMTVFFQSVAQFVTELKLTDSSRIEPESRLFPARPPPEIQFPVLRSFFVGFYRQDIRLDPVVRQRDLDFVRVILANAPRLVELESGPGFNYSVMRYLPPRQHLQKLTIADGLLDAQMRILELENIESVHHLTEFQLRLYHPGWNSESDPLTGDTLYRFLKLQWGSLDTLSVKMWNVHLRVHLPALPLLKNLKLVECSTELEPDCNYPALQKLTLQARNLARFFDFAGITQPLEAVTELELKFEDRASDVFPHVARVLPNLRKLTVNREYASQENAMRLVDLEPLGNVEELRLYVRNHEADQLLLSGHSENMIAMWKLLPRGLYSLAMDPPHFLQRLRKLTIAGYYVTLSEIACQLVLLKMPHLTCLDLSKCYLSPPGISEPVLAEMRAKFTVLLTAPVE